MAVVFRKTAQLRLPSRAFHGLLDRSLHTATLPLRNRMASTQVLSLSLLGSTQSPVASMANGLRTIYSRSPVYNRISDVGTTDSSSFDTVDTSSASSTGAEEGDSPADPVRLARSKRERDKSPKHNETKLKHSTKEATALERAEVAAEDSHTSSTSAKITVVDVPVKRGRPRLTAAEKQKSRKAQTDEQKILAKQMRQEKQNRPKRGKSAYLCFTAHELRAAAARGELKGGGLALSDRVKELGARWKSMPPEQKKIYEAESLKDKERYSRELADFQSQSSTSVVRTKAGKLKLKEKERPPEGCR